jgi:vancomycin resistance protein YoaR
MKLAALFLASTALALVACSTQRPEPPPSPIASPTGTPTARLDDRSAVEARLRALAPSFDLPARDATVSVDSDGTIRISRAQIGRHLDIAASTESYLTGYGPLVITEDAPQVTDAMAERVQTRVQGLLNQSLTVTFDDQALPLTRGDIAPLLAIHGATLTIDQEAAEALASLLAAELHRDPVDARFDWNGGQLNVLRESRPGRDLDAAQTSLRLSDALMFGQPSVALPVITVVARVSSADPAALGIVELIDRGSTSFAGSIDEKKTNIRLAAERLHGVVVPPGGTFSFNNEVGPTTLDAGFQWGFAITRGSDGPRTVPSVAGGICQVATTLFQPVFWTGFPLEERYAHAYWLPAYTSRGVIGLDVTVDDDAHLDFRWTNSSPDYVLIQASIDADSVRFALYGKQPRWRVEVPPAQVFNDRPADETPIMQDEPGLQAGRTLQVESARNGFDVSVTRVVSPLDGGEPRTLHLTTSYQPSHSVTLVGKGSG